MTLPQRDRAAARLFAVLFLVDLALAALVVTFGQALTKPRPVTYIEASWESTCQRCGEAVTLRCDVTTRELGFVAQPGLDRRPEDDWEAHADPAGRDRVYVGKFRSKDQAMAAVWAEVMPCR